MFFDRFRRAAKASRTRRPITEQDFSIEPLEDRKMLAGNVTAVMRGGDLIIRGDRFSNNIDIVPTQNGVRVIGFADPNGAATTVNGLAFADFSGPSQIADDVKITLGAGRDRVGLFVNVNDDVSINGGSNSDDLNVTSLIGGKLTINAGSADNLVPDFIDIVNTNVAEATRVKGGGGTQQVFVGNSNFFSTSSFNTGSGDDIMQITNSGFTNLRANGGSGRFDQFQAPFAAAAPLVGGFVIFV
ncbi:MAG: hypothetical protein AAGF97_07185 [Planctomycetota bacterium]